MCLSCVSPLQSVMDYWCSTDVTNKDYPCAAVCVPALPFPPSPGAVRTTCTAPKAQLVSSKRRAGPGSRAAQFSDAEIGCWCIAVAAGSGQRHGFWRKTTHLCCERVCERVLQECELSKAWHSAPGLSWFCSWAECWCFAATNKFSAFISYLYSNWKVKLAEGVMDVSKSVLSVGLAKLPFTHLIAHPQKILPL